MFMSSDRKEHFSSGLFDPYSKKTLLYQLNKKYSQKMRKVFAKWEDGTCAVFPCYFRGTQYMSVGKNVVFSRGTRIEAVAMYMGKRYKPTIEIGNRVQFNPNCHIGAINKVVIADDVLIGSNVLITDHSHGEVTREELSIPPRKRRLYSKGAVMIHKGVWIGENVSILPGVTIGKNAIIGANAVVTKDVPENAVMGGNPAKVIKML